jgi:hypothetical protein
VKRIPVLFILYLLPSFAFAQTTPDCSANNTNPPVSDIFQSNGNEHVAGLHSGSTGDGAGKSSLNGFCQYSNPASGTTCQTLCTITYNGTPVLLGDTQDLSVPGTHVVSPTMGACQGHQAGAPQVVPQYSESP